VLFGSNYPSSSDMSTHLELAGLECMCHSGHTHQVALIFWDGDEASHEKAQSALHNGCSSYPANVRHGRWTSHTLQLAYNQRNSHSLDYSMRGLYPLQANVTDNCNGTYAVQFSLPLAGDWALSASVGGKEVPWPEAAQLRAEYAPLAAQDCEISGTDGKVACGTSHPIFIQVRTRAVAPVSGIPCP